MYAFSFWQTMNLQQLRVFREIARHQFSLTAAAKALGTSQPALSRSVIELEGELGVPLFKRHGKRILGFSDAGLAVAARVDKVVGELQAIEQVGAEFRARDSGELRIATTHTQARYVLPALVKVFCKRYPAVRFTLLQGSPKQITKMALDREVDFAIATEVADDYPELRTLQAFEWEHWAVVPLKHPLADRMDDLSLADLARYPIVTYVEEFTGRRKIDKAFKDRALSPDIVLSAIDSDVIKTYVSVGLGVGILAAMAFDPDRDKGLIGAPVGHLFGKNQTKLTMRRDAFLRGYALSFIELMIPDVDKSTLV
jgi:LysR family transcriptional regulator, cys regulon transcriptional activator